MTTDSTLHVESPLRVIPGYKTHAAWFIPLYSLVMSLIVFPFYYVGFSLVLSGFWDIIPLGLELLFIGILIHASALFFVPANNRVRINFPWLNRF